MKKIEETFSSLTARFFAGFSFFILGIFLFFLWVLATTPSAKALSGCLTTKEHKIHLCEKDAQYVRLRNVSPYLKNLILIAEDASFYSHKGFDWGEIQNSLSSNLSQKKIVRGGSTITQQLAKNVFLDFKKSWVRKIREAFITKDLESIFTKDQIFEKYLNVIEFGPGLHGIRAAAEHYFKKHPQDLTLLESAYLTFLIPNPKVHSRTFKKHQLTDYAQFRILDLCYRLYRFNKISNDQYLSAKADVHLFPWENLQESTMDSSLSIVTPADPAGLAEPDDSAGATETAILPEDGEIEAPTYVEPSAEEIEPFDD